MGTGGFGRCGYGRVAVSGVAAATIAVGVLTGAGAGPVVAAPDSFGDRSVSKVTEDGWRVTAVKAEERVRSVAPLNQSTWTREGFLSLRGEGRISGAGRVAVSAGTVRAGFQIGCNTDVTSGLTLGVTAGPTAQMSISWPPALIVGAQASGNVSTTLKPGTIADIAFGVKRLAGPRAGLTVDGVHVKVDGCLGPVAVRSYVTVAISTPINDNTVNVYGTPHYL
ncbi:MspA family porin [Gordonia soli]|uniref:Porin MspA n=1 Tax=Gordonia soli NBRC 108243 TaxID=1223545 RepID=M0QG91_9ACTN|nr:MspA family porin [Gordonia soli]GAC67316.1 hypothetical protein GS4_07_00650 [Gordonia soli NBRC 108243]